MDRRHWCSGMALLGGICLLWASSVRGQLTDSGTSGAGIGLMPVTSIGGAQGQFGVVAVPMMSGSSSQGGQTGGASGVADPLGLNAVYGPAMPMTNGQAGLFLLSTQQRMLGLGNGRLSGTRPGVASDARTARAGNQVSGSHPVEAHTRNANVPGGQASRFFNRGGLAAQRQRPFYNRQLRQFPQTGQ